MEYKDMLREFYLEPKHDSRQSFYHKAVVVIELDRAILFSYGTRVAEFIHVENGLDMLKIYGLWSNTTLRHIREFVLQCGIRVCDIGFLRDCIEEKGVYI